MFKIKPILITFLAVALSASVCANLQDEQKEKLTEVEKGILAAIGSSLEKAETSLEFNNFHLEEASREFMKMENLSEEDFHKYVSAINQSGIEEFLKKRGASSFLAEREKRFMETCLRKGKTLSGQKKEKCENLMSQTKAMSIPVLLSFIAHIVQNPETFPYPDVQKFSSGLEELEQHPETPLKLRNFCKKILKVKKESSEQN